MSNVVERLRALMAPPEDPYYDMYDTKFNAAAREALPALLAVVEAAQAMREAQMNGMEILGSSHYDVMLERLAALDEVRL